MLFKNCRLYFQIILTNHQKIEIHNQKYPKFVWVVYIMKILLIGDMSSFYSNLSTGMRTYGNHVIHLASSDGYKKINLDNKVSDVFSDNKIKRILAQIRFYLLDSKNYLDFDIIMLINTAPFSLKFNLNLKILKKLKKVSKLLVLSSAGSNYFYYTKLKHLKYSALDESIKYDLNGVNNYTFKKNIINDTLVADLVDLIIPNTHTYSICYDLYSHKLSQIIPFPINVDKKHKESPLINQNDIKVRILYGITRDGFKGSRFIIPALDKVINEYNDLVEIKIVRRVSLKDFIIALMECDIYIDQCLSYEYGYSALYALKFNKIVLSGNEPESFHNFIPTINKRTQNPIINIINDENQVFSEIEKLIKNPGLIKKIQSESYKYVKEIHDNKLVSKIYIDVFESFLKNIKSVNL